MQLNILQTTPSRHINLYMYMYVESVLCNIWVPPLTPHKPFIVFTGSGPLIENDVFLLNETELSKTFYAI